MSTSEYMGDIGQYFYSKGEKKGVRKTLQESIHDILHLKFHEEGISLMEKIQRMRSVDKLLKIKNSIIQAQNLDEVQKVLSKI